MDHSLEILEGPFPLAILLELPRFVVTSVLDGGCR